MKCKLTNKEIKPFMSFGKMPLANGFLKENEFKTEFFYEMQVGFSEEISLFQLNEHPKPEKMFNEKYPFYTGSSNYMKKHFYNYSNWIKNNFFNSNFKLIEIGSNDGTFLSNFKKSDIEYIGFEPSKNVADTAIKNNVKTQNSFFNLKSVNNLTKFIGTTDVICASNVICHIPDLKELILTVDKLLGKRGLFIFEEPYLGSMFDKVSYDQIYDEHIYMFSVSSVKKIFEKFDFGLINIIPQLTHGGSMRYIIGRKNFHKVSSNVEETLLYENKKKIDVLESCINFKKNCEISKDLIKKKLDNFKNAGKKICGYAATSKSTTILNYCGVKNNLIDFICDTTKEKIGKYSPGVHIPIVSMDHFNKNKPNVAYLFAWNHKDEIFNKEREFTEKGGEWFSHVTL